MSFSLINLEISSRGSFIWSGSFSNGRMLSLRVRYVSLNTYYLTWRLIIFVSILSYLNGSSPSNTKLVRKKLFYKKSMLLLVTDNSVTLDYAIPFKLINKNKLNGLFSSQMNLIEGNSKPRNKINLPINPLSRTELNRRNCLKKYLVGFKIAIVECNFSSTFGRRSQKVNRIIFMNGELDSNVLRSGDIVKFADLSGNLTWFPTKILPSSYFAKWLIYWKLRSSRIERSLNMNSISFFARDAFNCLINSKITVRKCLFYTFSR